MSPAKSPDFKLELAAKLLGQDVARCRRQAAHRYRKAIEDFLIAAASGVDAVHLLLLDKNHPPSSLRNEVDVGGNVRPFQVLSVVIRPVFPTW